VTLAIEAGGYMTVADDIDAISTLAECQLELSGRRLNAPNNWASLALEGVLG